MFIYDPSLIILRHRHIGFISLSFTDMYHVTYKNDIKIIYNLLRPKKQSAYVKVGPLSIILKDLSIRVRSQSSKVMKPNRRVEASYTRGTVLYYLSLTKVETLIEVYSQHSLYETVWKARKLIIIQTDRIFLL